MASELKASRWETIGTLPIGGRLSVSDASYFYDSPVVVSITPGTYSVMVRYGTEDGHKYISALRVARGLDLVRGSRLGGVSVDFAQIAVCDRDAVEKAFEILGDAGMSTYFDQLQTLDFVKTITLSGNVEIFILQSGFGDGLYPIYLLGASDQVPAGIEVDFEHALHD